MNSFFDFLQQHQTGIFVLIACIAAAMMLVQWLAWIFSKGRFAVGVTIRRNDSLRFVFSDAIVKIINDFRHLLALIIVLIFAIALAYGMISAPSMAELKDALQAITATLGGLVGSIIGYYFGESSATKSNLATDSQITQQAQQQLPTHEQVVMQQPIGAAPPIPEGALDDNKNDERDT